MGFARVGLAQDAPSSAPATAQSEASAGEASSLARGISSLRQGEHKRAIAELRAALAEFPSLQDIALFHLGEALFAAGRFRNAAAAFGRAARVRPSRFVDRASERQADSLRRAGQPLAAMKLYRKLLKGYPDHPERARVELSLALCLRKARRHRQAAAALQRIWLSWPAREEADLARTALDRLRARGVKIAPPTLDQAIERARSLRRVKDFDRAIAELRALRRRHRNAADRIDLQLVLTYRSAQRPEEALSVVEGLVARVKRGKASVEVPRTPLRALHAELLAWTGKVDDAVALVLAGVPSKPNQRHRAALNLAVKLLAEHARYETALRYAELLAKISGPRSYRLRLAWLAYRAGKYDLAVARFKRLPRGQREAAFSLYWEARAHAKAGRTTTATALYRQLLEQHLRSYYGQLARSRLNEMGKLVLEPRICPELEQPPAQDLREDFASLSRRYGTMLPLLGRAAILHRVGLAAAMRKELVNAAIDFTWALHRGKKRTYRVRAEVARLWRGGEPSTNRWRLSPAERRLRRLKREELAELRYAFGALLRKAGVFYFGWRLGKADENLARHYYPRAYLDVVASVADQEDLDPNLLWAIMRKESAYRSDAISRVRAGGLMQLMPHTARRLAAEKRLAGFSFARVFEPSVNVSLAAHYVRALHHKFRGQLPLVAAAYNGGPHNVARWLEFRGAASTMDEFIEEIPFRESRRYSQKVLLLLSQYERTYCDKDDRLVSNTLNPRFNKYPSY